MNKEVVIWGGTGNFKVLCELLTGSHVVIGYFDNDQNVASSYNGIPCLGSEDSFGPWMERLNGRRTDFVVSIGHGKGRDRIRVHERLRDAGLGPIQAIHRTSFIASNAQLGEGAQIYAMASICVDASLGKSVIVNTRASIDHECALDDGVTIGPGAVLAGLVQVGRYADIYTGAIVLPRVRIGEGAVVGAGAIVRNDVEPYTVVVGNPARMIRRIER